MYNKRIICDIDDTISVTTNRDWENATPVTQVIDKINSLYDMGWEVWLFTARGQISCNGSLSARVSKYKKQIESWLKKHNVKYHKLSFQKELATYYIDDKSLTPEQFVSLDIQVLKSGWSGAEVELRDGRIYKTHKNSLQAAAWYEKMRHYFNVPKVYSVIGDTICMEYIKPNQNFNLFKAVNELKKFTQLPTPKNGVGFDNYIERIRQHCNQNGKFHKVVDLLSEYKVSESTYCHGDYSIENLLFKDGEVYLIDPIYEENSWSSVHLDVSKLMMSMRKHKIMYDVDIFKDLFIGVFFDWRRYLSVLEISQWVRVYKYAPEIEKQQIESTINDLIRNL